MGPFFNLFRVCSGLFDVAAVTFGRTVVALVTCLACFMGCILEFWSFSAVVAGTARTIISAIVVASGAIGNRTLVFGMVESNGTFLGVEFDFSRAVVGNDIGCNTDKSDQDQYGNQVFHLFFLLVNGESFGMAFPSLLFACNLLES
jgi:hypothetical protein